MNLSAFLSVLVALLAGGAAAEPGPPPARPAVPFVEDGDVGCHWMMRDPSEKWIRGSIGQGDDDPVISLVDTAFDSWSDSEEHAIEVSGGDPTRRVPATVWASGADGQAPGSIGFYMSANLRKLIGGATSLLIWKAGKPVLSLAFADTPSVEALDACVRPPGANKNSDSE